MDTDPAKWPAWNPVAERMSSRFPARQPGRDSSLFRLTIPVLMGVLLGFGPVGCKPAGLLEWAGGIIILDAGPQKGLE